MCVSSQTHKYDGQKINLKDGVEIAPAIIVYDNIIDNCEQLIDFAMSTPEKWRDSTIHYKNNDVINKKIRNTRIMDIPPIFSNDIKWFEVSQLIWNYANHYAIKHDVAFSNMEFPQLLHYSTEEGFYKAHADSGPSIQRIFSAILYLNNVEEGGETYFNKFNVSVKPVAGRLVLFPAEFPYIHEAKTPKSNDKFAIVTWFNPVVQ